MNVVAGSFGTKRQCFREWQRLSPDLLHLTNKKQEGTEQPEPKAVYDTAMTPSCHLLKLPLSSGDIQCTSKSILTFFRCCLQERKFTKDAVEYWKNRFAMYKINICIKPFLFIINWLQHWEDALHLSCHCSICNELYNFARKKQKHTSGFRLIDRAWRVQRSAHSIVLFLERRQYKWEQNCSSFHWITLSILNYSEKVI